MNSEQFPWSISGVDLSEDQAYALAELCQSFGAEGVGVTDPTLWFQIAVDRDTALELQQVLRNIEDDSYCHGIREELEHWLGWPAVAPEPKGEEALEEEERRFLASAMEYWVRWLPYSDPKTQDAVRVPTGLRDSAEFRVDCKRIYDKLINRQPLLSFELARAVYLTEMAFGSSILGLAPESRPFSKVSDDESFHILRRIQAKFNLGIDSLRQS